MRDVSLVTADDPIEVPTVGGRAPKIISRAELTNILEPRAAEIAKLIWRDLEKVGLEREIARASFSSAAER
jgi:cell division protein FtsA